MEKFQLYLKKALKASVWFIAILLLIFIIIVGLIHIPAIQNKIAQAATSFISKKTHTRVDLKKITISFPKSVVIKGLFLEDLQQDTLVYAGELKVNIAFRDLLSRKIGVKNFVLEDLTLNLIRTSNDSLFNFNFLITSFSKPGKEEEVKPPSSSKWSFSIDNVRLKNIRVSFLDEYGGTDVAAFLGNLELKMNELDLENSIYNMDALLIERLTTIVSMKEPVKPKETKEDGVLPQILANKLQIKDSKVIYRDSVSEQSLVAMMNRIELKEGSVDLQKEVVTANSILVSKSEFQFHTVDKELATDSSLAVNNKAEGNNWEVTVNRIELEENSLNYQSGTNSKPGNYFDAKHLEYEHVSLSARDFYYSSAKTIVSIRKFTAVDHNNFSITKFETDFSMDQHSITAKELIAETSNSYIDADLNLQFSSLESLKDSLPWLKLNLDLENVSIQNSDILYFSPELIKQPFFKNRTNRTTLSGSVNGSVNDLTGRNIHIKTGVITSMQTDFSISGLPDAENAWYSFPNLQLNTGKEDIIMAAGPYIPDSIEIPKNISIQADFEGLIKEFTTHISLESSYGTVLLTADIDKNENFNGKINIDQFDLGRLLKNTEMYGPVTLTAEAKGQGVNKETVTATIEAEVSHFYLNQYNYQNLSLDGQVRGQEFEGKINLNDEYAVFDFDGLVNVNPDQEQIKFRLNVEGINLQKLNFTNEDIRIGLVAAADLKGGRLEKMNGTAGISNLIVAKGEKVYALDSVLFASINETKKSQFNFSSALMNVKYSGTMSPNAVSGELNRFINNYFQFSDTVQFIAEGDSSNFNFEIELHNHPIISDILLPQLKEFEPGIIEGSFNREEKGLKLKATIHRMEYGTTAINDLVLDVSSDSAKLNYKLSSSNISSAQIGLENVLFEGTLANNIMQSRLSSIDENKNKKIDIGSELTKDSTHYRLEIEPEDFHLMHNRWEIAEDNYIGFGKQGFLIHNFLMTHEESQIHATSVNNLFNDDLNIEIQNFRLDDVSRIFEKDTSLLKGTLDGNVLLKRVNDSYGVIANAEISELFIRDIPIGNLTIKADDPSASRFDIQVDLSGNDNQLTVNGYYIPGEENDSINFTIDITSLSMKTIEAFSLGQISETAGMISGNFLMEGSTNAPAITGELVFNDAFLKPAILNNRLELKNEAIQFKPGGIFFNSFTLLDAGRNSASIDGSIQMKQFKDFIFALQVNTEDFLLLNTTSRDNEDYFGRMVIDSRININGPLALPVISGRLKMKEGSRFTFAVPEEKLTTDRGEGVVEFEDSLTMNSILYQTSDEVAGKSRITGFDLSSIIEIDKDATLTLLIDPASNDSLVVRGEAALSFTMDRSGKMSLTGAYYLDEGSYLVSLESFVKRRFDIISGSSIIWNGDPVDASISINAKYIVRAAPYDLVAGQLSDMSDSEKGSYKQQYPFWVMLKLRGEILQPLIGFEIQLAPEDKGILGGAVNQKLITLNEDPSALNKQVFALLIMGRFVQENPLQTESGGTSALVRSTVGNFLSSQLNKLSSKFLPGTELNFDVQSYEDYQSGQAEGRTELGIGVKQQLFNERLSVQVGGSIDVEGEKASQNSASEITTDVTVEYKITEDGRYRLKGFRHNQYEGALEGQIVETGAGVVYVRDFNKWKELFRAPENKKKNKNTDLPDE